MPTLPEKYSKEWEPTQTQRFDAILGRIASNLLRESSTEFNFLEVKEKLLNVQQQVEIISKTFDFWTQLPDAKRNNLNSVLDDMIVQFESMELFDPKQNNAWELRTNIIANFNSRYNGFYEHVVVPLNGYLGRKAYTQELTSKFGKEAEKELAEIRRVRKEIENVQSKVLDAASVTAGDVASTAQAVSFGDQANEHATNAKKWLTSLCIVGIFSLVITLMVVIEIIREINDDNFTANAESNLLKIAVLAFLYLGIRFIIRNYSAHQHLYIINKHRANILKSMEAFRVSALADPAKDSILLAAVGVAYSQQETGFITTKEGAGSEDGELMNIVKTASGK